MKEEERKKKWQEGDFMSLRLSPGGSGPPVPSPPASPFFFSVFFSFSFELFVGINFIIGYNLVISHRLFWCSRYRSYSPSFWVFLHTRYRQTPLYSIYSVLRMLTHANLC